MRLAQTLHEAQREWTRSADALFWACRDLTRPYRSAVEAFGKQFEVFGPRIEAFGRHFEEIRKIGDQLKEPLRAFNRVPIDLPELLDYEPPAIETLPRQFGPPAPLVIEPAPVRVEVILTSETESGGGDEPTPPPRRIGFRLPHEEDDELDP